MRYDKFTTKFQQALSDAQSLAVGNDQQFIEPQHLLLALLNQDDGSTTSLLQRAGVNGAGLKAALGKALERLPKVQGHGGEVSIGRDLGKRPFALVGFVAFVALVPLAATSFDRAIRVLGAARWQRLHRLVYAIVVLGWLHLLWMRASKHRFDDVLVYAGVIGVLLGVRLVGALRRRPAPA